VHARRLGAVYQLLSAWCMAFNCSTRVMGRNAMQVCTGVMLHGYPLVKHLCGGLQEFMKRHKFESIEDFRGSSLPYFTTHKALYEMQQEAIAQKKARKGLKDDAEWTGEGFVRETETMVSN
jgi:dihydropyrimidine dehydrogenase (NADP+)